MKNNIQDERVINEGLKAYKVSFYVLCIGIFFDLIIKFNLYSFGESTLETALAFLIEAMLLVTVFYLNIFILASKGIAPFISDVNLDKFPKKRYALISGIVGGVISVGLWTIRFCTGSWEYGLASAILFCTLIYIFTFIIAFAILFVSFYVSFRIAKKKQVE